MIRYRVLKCGIVEGSDAWLRWMGNRVDAKVRKGRVRGLWGSSVEVEERWFAVWS